MEATHLVTDPEDPRVSEYRHMNDQATRRKMEGDEYFLSEGWLSIDHLIETGHRFRSVLLSPSRVNRFRPYMERPELQGAPVFVAERDVMRAIVGFDMPRAVVMAMDRRPLVPLDELAATASRLIVLEALNDDQNIGAIARAARAFGMDGLVLSPTCADPYYRRTVRVSMGEILHLPVARVSRDGWPTALGGLHEAGFASWAMTPHPDARSVWDVAPARRLAIVLGAEGPGLTDAVLEMATNRVRIPISRQVDSLNVGHAAAITFAAISRG